MENRTSNLEIEYVPIGSIKKYKRNAKLHPPEQIKEICESIKPCSNGEDLLSGFKDPIGVWRGEIVEGHGRYMAAQELGMEIVPVIRLDDMTDEQRRAYMLIHNQTTMDSGWDTELLDIELADIDMDMEPWFEDGISPDECGEKFSLPEGDKTPIQTMTFTFSDDEAEQVRAAIAEAKRSRAYENYDNPLNENGNGRALFLVVSEWRAQRI